ncbi:Hypothetical predicted protein [Pelobates cultripes]|uniref:L1 transposable element RRM domain-containing protein n=1 Tax=Pelobates cultripes TaxID=61616 RepID=A0AAD1RWF2_PELCU|nr:Hypothetical predicted protein [Pelobates cultripes]CAH2281606.1 Hypothetical predicted protein [Pelobates cultripes]
MGRTWKPTDPSGTPRSSGREGEQSIRSYLQATARPRSPQREMEEVSQGMESFPSTPARLSTTPSIMSEPQQTQEGEWRAILPNLLTKADFEALSDRLGRVVREEVAQLRADLANVEARMSVAESETRALRTDLEHTNSTVASQEADLASLTTWVDDLDNRGRRVNLGVRGVREGDPAEHIPDTLKRLFTQILGGQQIPRLGIVRAHRALRPMPPPEEQPRDIICCLENHQLKEDILRTARRMGTIRFENQTHAHTNPPGEEGGEERGKNHSTATHVRTLEEEGKEGGTEHKQGNGGGGNERERDGWANQ